MGLPGVVQRDGAALNQVSGMGKDPSFWEAFEGENWHAWDWWGVVGVEREVAGPS